jgi:molybdopterin-guanine dinucleotide biosynthesis protein A
MGRDKAMLEFHGSTFAGRIAECVRRVAGNVTLVGPPDRYRELGYTVIPDRVPGCGPLGGVYTALSSSHAEWNLIVACDMPPVTTEFFEALFTDVFGDAESGASTVDCVIPELARGGPELARGGPELARSGPELAQGGPELVQGGPCETSTLDPLCAVYHRRCAAAARRALDRKILKMHDFFSTLCLRKHPVTDPALLRNINTRPEWSTL